MIRRSLAGGRLPLAGAVVAAALLAFAGVPITSAQGMTLFPAAIDGTLPVDAPWDNAWNRAASVDVPLSGQPAVTPTRPQPAFPFVRVRALVDSSRVAVLLEWADQTKDESTLAVDAFSDAAAVQIALGTGTSICMGQQAGGLNIWHWRADWAADLADRRGVTDAHPNMPDDEHFPADPDGGDLTPDGFLAGRMAGNPFAAADRPTSVQDLNAVGFGSLTSQAPSGQNVHGASEYRDGIWRVVFSRELTPADANDAILEPGSAVAVVAFALWDGATGDRNGQKSVSAWLSLALPKPGASLFDIWPFLVMLVLALAFSAAIIAYGSRQPAIGLGWPPGGPRRPEDTDGDAAAGGPDDDAAQ
jgi:hypothetical protein